VKRDPDLFTRHLLNNTGYHPMIILRFVAISNMVIVDQLVLESIVGLVVVDDIILYLIYPYFNTIITIINKNHDIYIA